MRKLSILFVALAVTGCRCDRGLSTLVPELIVVEPTTKSGETTWVADFGTVSLGGSAVAHVKLENHGSLRGLLTKIELRAGSDPAFALDRAGVPLVIEPGAAGGFDILLQANRAATLSGFVDVTTDDMKLKTFVIELRGSVPPPQIPTVQVCVDDGTGTFICHDTLEISDLAIDFGAVQVGSPMLKRRAEVRSVGNQPLDYFGTAFDNASSPLFGTTPPQAPGASATTLQPMQKAEFEFTYDPSIAGPADAIAYVNTTDMSAESVPVRLHGRAAVSTTCHLSVSPAVVDFGSVPNNSTSDQTVVVVNDGLADCAVSALTLTGSAAFTLTMPPTAPLTMTPNDVVTFGVHYAASGTATHMGSITIASNDPVNGMLMIPVRATSIDPPPCQLIATPPALDFGGVSVGDRVLRSVRLSATGSDPCTLNSARIKNGNTHFIAGTVTAFPPVIVMPGTPFLGSPEIGVTYAPTVSRTDADTLEITYTAGLFGGSQHRLNVPLTGRAGTRQLCVVPNRLHYGAVPSGQTKDLSFTMTACGGTGVDVTSITVEPVTAPWTLGMGPNLPLVLNASQSASQVVRLTSTGMATNARVKVTSGDPTFPVQYVDLDTGPQLVPPDAGEVLYSWTAGIGVQSGSIYVTRLQGPPQRRAFYGSGNGQACSGCHAVSPDGKYVALVEFGSAASMRVIDARTGGSIPIAGTSDGEFPSWRPDTNTNPPYQFVYAAGGRILKVASVVGGVLREVQGANNPVKVQTQPSWGPNGKIVFVRGEPADAGGDFSITGPCDLVEVPEGGGTATVLAGASMNGGGNYLPEYSPNGKYIAYTFSAAGMTTRSAPDSVVKLVEVATGTVLPLPQLNASIPNSWPTWARDGSFLSFSSTRSGGSGSADIYFAPVSQVTGVDGPAQPLTLVNTPEFDHIARWAFLPPP